MGQHVPIFILILLLAFIGYSIQVDHGTELNLVTRSVTLLANSTFEVECSGYYPVKWIYPADWRSLVSSKAQVNESFHSNKIKPHVSSLRIEDLEYRFTGRYICASTIGIQPDEEAFDDEFSGAVYLYVYDEDHLLAPLTNKTQRFASFPVFASSTLIIPCRPTRPEITVQLTGVREELIQSAIFDPRRGFIFEHPTFALEGIFHCTAVYEDLKETQMVLLRFHPENTVPREPMIDESAAKFPVVGKPFMLDCIIFKDLNTIINVKWTYPEGNDDIEIKNTTSRDFVLRSVQKLHRLSTKLEVSKATQNHTGYYKCTATRLKETYSTTIYIQIYDQAPDPFVNLSSSLVSPFYVKISTDIKVVVNYEVHSTEVENKELYTQWTNNTLLMEPSSRVSMVRGEKKVILRIKSAEIEDTGNYTLYLRIGGRNELTANWTVTIFVKSGALASVPNRKQFYKLGTNFTLRCEGKGYPTAQVWWRWSPCTNYAGKCDKPWTDVELESSQTESPNSAFVGRPLEESRIRVIRNLTVTARTSGSFLCKTSNELGVSEELIPFIVAGNSSGHWITTSKQKPIEGQVFNMTCGASKFVYKALNWSVVERDPIENGTNSIVMVKTEDSLSVFSTLVFRPLSLNHKKTYRCTAIPKSEDGKKETVDEALQVTDLLAPRFLNQSLSGTLEYKISSSETVRFPCDHELGNPPSTVVWTKDGKRLNQTKDNAIEKKGAIYRISRVRATDAGLYTCRVYNDAGTISRNFSLVVLSDADSSQWIYIGIFLVVLPVLIVLIVILLRKIYREKRARREQEVLEKYLFDRGQMSMFNPELPLDEQVNLLPYNQKWEFPRDRLRLGRVLGQGAFGRVVKAEAVGLDDSETHSTVAVKMLKERADSVQLKALVAELKILIHLGSHLNILNLLGAVTKNMGKGELMVIVEYCRYGNIRNYLLRYRSNFRDQLDPVTGRVDVTRMPAIDEDDYLNPKEQLIGNGFSNPNYHGASSLPDTKLNYAHLEHIQTTGSDAATTYPATPGATSTSPWDTAGYTTSSGTVNFRSRLASEGMTMTKKSLCTCDLLCFAFQCARGMEYLASRKLIHRDLAARNVLLAEDNIVKICDFGLTKECYKDDAYVKKTDGPLPIKWMAIESIGDKIFTTKSDVWAFGVLLWEFFTLGGNPYPGIELDEDFYRKLRSGYRMERPRYAPDDLYNLMSNCWHDDPTQRPPFDALAQKLGDLLEAGVKQYYLDLNTPYMEMNCRDPPPVDYLSMGVQGEGSNYLTMDTDSCTAHYDNVTNVRPVEGEGPAPLQPLEVISMIQLEPVTFAPANKKKSLRKPLEPPRTPTEGNKVGRPEDPAGDVESDLLGRYPSTEEEEDEVASVVFELNSSMDKSNEDYMTMGHVTHLDRSRKGNESLRSAASSGFHSDLEVPERISPPPYNLVMENVR